MSCSNLIRTARVELFKFARVHIKIASRSLRVHIIRMPQNAGFVLRASVVDLLVNCMVVFSYLTFAVSELPLPRKVISKLQFRSRIKTAFLHNCAGLQIVITMRGPDTRYLAADLSLRQQSCWKLPFFLKGEFQERRYPILLVYKRK